MCARRLTERVGTDREGIFATVDSKMFHNLHSLELHSRTGIGGIGCCVFPLVARIRRRQTPSASAASVPSPETRDRQRAPSEAGNYHRQLKTPKPTPETFVESTVGPTTATEPRPPTPVATALPVEPVVGESNSKVENGCLNKPSGETREYTPGGEAPPELLTAVDQLQWVREADSQFRSTCFS